MAFRFVALVAALACVSSVAAFPRSHGHGYALPAPVAAPCGAPVEVVTSVIPGPVTIGPGAAGVVGHASAPYELNYFEKPWVVKHQKSAALNVFTQTPVVVDEYEAPCYNEGPGPQTVAVEEVYGAPIAIGAAPGPVVTSGHYGAYNGAGYGAGYGAYNCAYNGAAYGAGYAHGAAYATPCGY